MMAEISHESDIQMAAAKKNRKLCPAGHIFYKSSDCPVCPVCEKNRKPVNEWMLVLSAPARRALEKNNLNSLKKIAHCTEKEILSLHGIGPSALPKLKTALQEAGLKFKPATSNYE
jgi:DNA-directed RNA polymerase alpha subunit